MGNILGGFLCKEHIALVKLGEYEKYRLNHRDRNNLLSYKEWERRREFQRAGEHTD